MRKTIRHTAGALLSLAASCTWAQDAGAFSVAGGLRLWQMQWTTFSYADAAGGGQVLTQSVAGREWVTVPLLNLRWDRWVLAASGYGRTSFDFPTSRDSRSEYDINLGWSVLPGLALTAGWKHVSQRGDFIYEPSGLVIGASASAPLGAGLSLQGTLGAGTLKTRRSGGRYVEFDAVYRLAEVGLAYSLPLEPWARTVSLTAGWRMQTLGSKDALGSQDGRDITEGLTLGLLARF